jgi:hypothetical protein
MSADLITWQTTHGDTVEVYESVDLIGPASFDMFWRYRVRAANRKVVEQGSEGYTRRRAAIKAAERHHPRVEES